MTTVQSDWRASLIDLFDRGRVNGVAYLVVICTLGSASKGEVRREAVARMTREGVSDTAIIREVFGVTGGKRFAEARARLDGLRSVLS